MKKVVAMPHIGQFRNIVETIKRRCEFVEKNEAGEAIYDKSKSKITLSFLGTCKLHGTCFGINYNHEDGIWTQSKDYIIDAKNDNAGSAMFAYSKEDSFKKLFKEIENKFNIDTRIYTITIFGEWVGPGIQKKVAISKLQEKSMFIIGIKISKLFDIDFAAYWVDHTGFRDTENRIYNILDYKTYSITIDFNHPELSVSKIDEITMEIEKECPVGKEFGILDIGEGVVFSCEHGGSIIRFKNKGLLHKKNDRVKKEHSPEDDEKTRKIMEVAEQVTPLWRLEQMLEQTCGLNNGGTVDRSKLGDFLKSLFNDVIKEDLDILAEARLESKEVSKYISQIGRDYFFEQEKSNLGV